MNEEEHCDLHCNFVRVVGCSGGPGVHHSDCGRPWGLHTVLYSCSGSSDWDPACVRDGCDVLPLDPYMPSADVALGLQGMLPMYLAWPNALQTSPGCIQAALGMHMSASAPRLTSRQIQMRCLKLCSSDAFCCIRGLIRELSVQNYLVVAPCKQHVLLPSEQVGSNHRICLLLLNHVLVICVSFVPSSGACLCG